MRLERPELGRGSIGLLLVLLCFVGHARADTTRESEPNDTPATANATVGVNGVSVVGAIGTATDQDYFTFLVTKTGVPIPGFTTAVDIAITQNPGKYFFELTHESGTIIFSGVFAGPYYFDFNANAVGGIGKYTLRISAVAPYIGAYAFSIVGVADGVGAVPPTVMGAASMVPRLDTSFGVNGIVERSLVGSAGQANGIVALADSTLLASGFFWHGYRGGFGGIRVYDAFVSTHYSADGQQALTPPPFFPRLVQRDGKMIGINPTGLTRVNQDGSPDPAYITNGAASIPWFANMSQQGLAQMALQADGKVVVAGNSSYTVVLLRFNTDGSLDPTFNYIGAMIVPHGDSDIDNTTAGLVIQPDGKIAVAANSSLGLAGRLTLLRFNADGSADAAFGNNGRSTIPIAAGSYVYANRLVLQPNGRLVVLGAGAVAVMKMLGFRPQDGAPDPTFGNAGVVDTTIAGVTSTAQVDQAMVTPDGKLLVAFNFDQAPHQLMRFTADGAPDSTFGVSGSFASAPLPVVTAMALLPDGDLALGGTTAGGNFGLGLFTSGSSPAIEYYNASLNHYFLTMIPREVAELDLGVFAGWQRTGLSFLTYGSAAAAAGTTASPVCRFYIPPQHGNSHFISADPVECAIARDKVTTDPNFSGYVEETSSAFYIGLPDKVTGACPPNTTPVYRLWNQGSASNHRYTASVVVKNQMIASGWVAEGYGPSAVDMCAPQ